MTVVIVVAAVVVVFVAVGLTAGRRRSRDGVDSFRRQIDALSPEARRPVVDQVQNAAERQEASGGDDSADLDPDDEDGARGT